MAVRARKDFTDLLRQSLTITTDGSNNQITLITPPETNYISLFITAKGNANTSFYLDNLSLTEE